GKLMALAMATLAAALVLLANLSTMTSVMIYAATIGVGGSLVTVIFFAAWGRTFGRKDLGKIQGIAQGLCIVAAAIGPRIVAQIHPSCGSYRPAFYAFAAVAALFALWAAAAPLPRVDAENLGTLPATPRKAP